MDWTFLQIEGPEDDRKKIVLSGWDAPFGRERKDPILKEVIKSRVQTTRYPGGTGQTRHAFGTNYESMELKGRWMSRHSETSANDMVDAWTAFVRDEKTIRVSWGNIISWQGFIEEIEFGRESKDAVSWRMRILIDDRDDQKKTKAPPKMGSSLPNLDKFIQNWVRKGKLLLEPTLPDISPGFLESLDNLAAEINKPAAIMNKLANDVSNIEAKTYSTLQHFRGAVSQMRTAVNTIRETVLTTTVDAAMLVRTAESDLAWATYVSNLDFETYLVMERLAVMDRELEIAQKIDVARFITARDGESWESLSTRATGSPTKASDIRNLNGVRYGERPVAGAAYLVQ